MARRGRIDERVLFRVFVLSDWYVPRVCHETAPVLKRFNFVPASSLIISADTIDRRIMPATYKSPDYFEIANYCFNRNSPFVPGRDTKWPLSTRRTQLGGRVNVSVESVTSRTITWPKCSLAKGHYKSHTIYRCRTVTMDSHYWEIRYDFNRGLVNLDLIPTIIY